MTADGKGLVPPQCSARIPRARARFACEVVTESTWVYWYQGSCERCLSGCPSAQMRMGRWSVTSHTGWGGLIGTALAPSPSMSSQTSYHSEIPAFPAWLFFWAVHNNPPLAHALTNGAGGCSKQRPHPSTRVCLCAHARMQPEHVQARSCTHARTHLL